MNAHDHHPYGLSPDKFVAVSPGAALLLSGILKPSHSLERADATAWKQIARGGYPFPLREIPGATRRKYVVLVSDIEGTLRGNADPQSSCRHVEVPSRPRGRPRYKQRQAATTHPDQEMRHE